MRRVMLIDAVEALARRELRWIRGLWVVGDLLNLLDLLSLGWRRQWMAAGANSSQDSQVGVGWAWTYWAGGGKRGLDRVQTPGLGKLWLPVESYPVESLRFDVLCCALLGDRQRVN